MTTSPVMHLLDSGVPLTLLMDLLDPSGPDSAAINASERPPGDPIWLDAADRPVDLRVVADFRARHTG